MQPTQSIGERDALPEPESAPESIELKSGWFQGADGTLILKREETSHGVRAVEAGLEAQARGWQAGVIVEGELTGEQRRRLRMYAQRAFGERVRAFAEWNDESGGSGWLLTGVEYSLFGEDKWLLSRKIVPEYGPKELQDTFQLTLPLSILGLDRLQFVGVRGGELTELRGELSTSLRDNVEIGASVGTQRAPITNAEGYFWSVPQVQGCLRFNW